MTKREKRLERMRENPRTVRFEDMDTLLLSYGFSKRQRDSHAVYTLNQRRQTIPFRIPYLLPIYVKEVLAMLDAMIDAGELEI